MLALISRPTAVRSTSFSSPQMKTTQRFISNKSPNVFHVGPDDFEEFVSKSTVPVIIDFKGRKFLC